VASVGHLVIATDYPDRWTNADGWCVGIEPKRPFVPIGNPPRSGTATFCDQQTAVDLLTKADPQRESAATTERRARIAG
jgi:hypothetical protein